MSAPQSSGVPSAPAEQDDDEVAGGGARGRRASRARWWLVVLLAVVLVVLLVVQPWSVRDVAPAPSPTPSAPVAEQPTASPEPTPTSSAAPAPGADAVFDATTATSLLLSREDLEQSVPAAAAGVERRVEPGTRPWGLPIGGAVMPAECTLAVTIVDRAPVHYDAAAWGNDELLFEQEVVVLEDAATARAAFRALVTTLDACPEYAVTFPDTGSGAARTEWVADPAIEGQGVFPSVVHDLVRVTDRARPLTAGHALVGNTVVTWTAAASAAEDAESGRAVLGPAQDLAGAVEERALAAVRALP